MALILYLLAGVVVTIAAIPMALMLVYAPLTLLMHPEFGMLGTWQTRRADLASTLRRIEFEMRAQRYGS